MNARQLATALALGRVAIGSAMFLAPGTFGPRYIGEDAERPGTQLVMRVAGIRDLVLGVGTLLALQNGTDANRWTEAGIVSDAGDAIAGVLAYGHTSRTTALSTVVAAAGAAGVGAYVRRTLDREHDARWA